MEKLKEKMKENKAITLIALVITIVVLIILASVAINMTLGNNGLFTRAKTAKEQYQNAQDYEQTQIAKYSNEIDSYVGGGRGNIEKELLYSNDNGWNSKTEPLVLSKNWNEYDFLQIIGTFSALTDDGYSEEYISKELLTIIKNRYQQNKSITLSKYDNYYMNIFVKNNNTFECKDFSAEHNKIYYIYGIK